MLALNICFVLSILSFTCDATSSNLKRNIVDHRSQRGYGYQTFPINELKKRKILWVQEEQVRDNTDDYHEEPRAKPQYPKYDTDADREAYLCVLQRKAENSKAANQIKAVQNTAGSTEMLQKYQDNASEYTQDQKYQIRRIHRSIQSMLEANIDAMEEIDELLFQSEPVIENVHVAASISCTSGKNDQFEHMDYQDRDSMHELIPEIVSEPSENSFKFRPIHDNSVTNIGLPPFSELEDFNNVYMLTRVNDLPLPSFAELEASIL